MEKLNNSIIIRKFTTRDAEFCHRIRQEAFESTFINEIGKEAVQAGVTAFSPDRFIQMAEDSKFFIPEFAGQAAGFFIVKRMTDITAELVLIYFDIKYHKKGLGRICSRFIDDWVRDNWQEVRTIFVDTVIPKYNGDFYRKMGYLESDIVDCCFPEMTIPATRFIKRL